MSRAREIADLVGGTTPDIILKTADGAILNLQTSDTTVTDGSVLGAVNFTAPNEGSGTDALLVGASIQAISEGTFAADNNATQLVFKTGASEAAATKMTLTSAGKLGIGVEAPAEMLEVFNAASPAIQLNDGGDYKSIFRLAGNDLEIRGSSGNMEFYTGNADGDSSTERFRIASDGSLSTPTAGTSNVRLGVNAGNSIASGGNYNTVIGDEAGTAITTGDENTLVG